MVATETRRHRRGDEAGAALGCRRLGLTAVEAAVTLVGLSMAVMLPFVAIEVLRGASGWQGLDRARTDVSGAWSVLGAVAVAVSLCIGVVVMTRVLRHAVADADPLLAAGGSRPEAGGRVVRVTRAWVATAMALVAAGTVLACVHEHAAHLGDLARTATATASVVGSRFVDGDDFDEPRTELDVVVRIDGDLVTESVSLPGRGRLRVEDEVEVAYDPRQPANMELARRPPLPELGYRVAIAIATPVMVASAGVALVLAGANRRAARGVARPVSPRAGGCA